MDRKRTKVLFSSCNTLGTNAEVVGIGGYPHETENDFISKLGKNDNYHLHDECWDKIAEQLVGGI